MTDERRPDDEGQVAPEETATPEEREQVLREEILHDGRQEEADRGLVEEALSNDPGIRITMSTQAERDELNRQLGIDPVHPRQEQIDEAVDTMLGRGDDPEEQAAIVEQQLEQLLDPPQGSDPSLQVGQIGTLHTEAAQRVTPDPGALDRAINEAVEREPRIRIRRMPTPGGETQHHWTSSSDTSRNHPGSVVAGLRVEDGYIGRNLDQLDVHTAYRMDSLSRSQLDTLALHGVEFQILHQPPNEPHAHEPVYSILLRQAVLDVVQRRLQVIFTQYAAHNDLEGVMGLQWINFTWPREDEPVPETEVRGASADQFIIDDPVRHDATITIMDDLPDPEPRPGRGAVDETENPEPNDNPEEMTYRPADTEAILRQERFYQDFPLRRPYDMVNAPRNQMEHNFIATWNQLLADVEYAEIVTADNILLGAIQHATDPLQLLEDTWPQADGLHRPDTMSTMEQEFDELADDDNYEEVTRRAAAYIYTGLFDRDEIVSMLSGRYDIDDGDLPAAEVPFYYYHFILMAYGGAYGRAQEIGMQMLTNRFIQHLAQTYGDDYLTANELNSMQRLIVPILTSMQAVPSLEPEDNVDTPPAAPRPVMPPPRDPRRAEIVLNTADAPVGDAELQFLRDWNGLLQEVDDEVLEDLHVLYGDEYARRPLDLIEHGWPTHWFPSLTEDVETAIGQMEEYIANGEFHFVEPYANMLVAVGFIEDSDLDTWLEENDFTVTEVYGQALYMSPIIRNMFAGQYLTAAESAVRMLQSPFVEIIVEYLGDDFSAGEANIVMRLLTDQQDALFDVQMETTPGQAPRYSVQARRLSAQTRVDALHQAVEPAPVKEEGPKALDEGMVTFSSRKAPVHDEFQDTEGGYWLLAEEAAERMGVNLAFMSRDSAHIKSFTKGTKEHRTANGTMTNYDPALISGFKHKGMVTDNTIYVHVNARPYRSIIVKKVAGMPDKLILNRNLTGEGEPFPDTLAHMTFGDRFVEARYLKYQLMSVPGPSSRRPDMPVLRADFEMDGQRTWNYENKGDVVLARFSDPQNVYVNFQMLRFDSEASYKLFEHVVQWIQAMVYFDVTDVHEGLPVAGEMKWTQAAQLNIANDHFLLQQKRLNRYVQNFKSTVIGDIDGLQKTLVDIQSNIRNLNETLIVKGREEIDTINRIEGLKEKDAQFGTMLKAEIESVSRMEGIASFEVMSDGLMIMTEYLLMHDDRTDDWFELGECEMMIKNKGTVTILNKTRTRPGLKSSMNHPHIYPDGNPCWGDMTKTIPSYFRAAAISGLADAVLQVLVMVNSADTAGAYVTKWPKCKAEKKAFLNETFKSKFQAGRIGHAAYNQHLAEKEEMANVLKTTKWGSETSGGGAFPSDEELELAAGFIDEDGNITVGGVDSGAAGQAEAGGRSAGTPGMRVGEAEISADGSLRERIRARVSPTPAGSGESEADLGPSGRGDSSGEGRGGDSPAPSPIRGGSLLPSDPPTGTDG